MKCVHLPRCPWGISPPHRTELTRDWFLLPLSWRCSTKSCRDMKESPPGSLCFSHSTIMQVEHRDPREIRKLIWSKWSFLEPSKLVQVWKLFETPSTVTPLYLGMYNMLLLGWVGVDSRHLSYSKCYKEKQPRIICEYNFPYRYIWLWLISSSF